MTVLLLVIGFIAAALLSAWAVGYLVRGYQQSGHLDEPNHRSMHVQATPTGAGVVIGIAAVVSLLSALIWQPQLSTGVLLVVVSCLTLVGWFDDRLSLPVRLRLLLFLGLAALLVFTIGPIGELRFSADYAWKLGYFGWLLTILSFLWVVNLYNFMDGMDGLAGSQALIACLILAWWFYQWDVQAMMVVALVVAAATVGFLYWNWSPAKIFMGDVGSLALGGFFIVLLLIAITQHRLPVLAAILVLGVFVFDATYTLLCRLIKGERIYQAHSSHIYQRLAKAGVAHKHIVLVYGAVMVLLGLLAEALRQQWLSSLIAGVIGLISVISLLFWAVRIENANNSANDN